MENIIKAAVERGASDIHIKAGDVFRARIGGVLKALTKQRLTAEQTRTIALDMIPNEEDRKRIDQIRDYDCSWGSPGIGRFRVNILRQRSSFMVVLRAIPFDVPTLDRLNLPKVLATIAELEAGLVLVTGGAGSGKTSTIAALLHHINSSTTRHVVTIEDPIEFLHRDLKSSITQREVGMDTESFATALKAVTRQDPDVIVLGDVPDATSIEAIMRAAEIGKLAIASVSAADAPHAVDRLVGMFAPAEQESVRVRVIEALSAVISQKLVSRAEGEGLVVAVEVARGTPEVRDALRDPTRAADDLPGVIAAGRDSQAMQTFDQHLADLVEAEVISPAVAKTAARDPKTFSGKKR
jgi:twitching motility protein PilT